MTHERSWEKLAEELESIKAIVPLRADWRAYVGSEEFGIWLIRPDGPRMEAIHVSFGLIAARAIEKAGILPIPVPQPLQHCPHWAEYCGVEEELAHRAGKALDLSDAVPHGLGVDSGGVDPCTRAFLEVLRLESRAFRINAIGTETIKDKTYARRGGIVEDLCGGAAAYCKRRARDEIGARLANGLESEHGADLAGRDLERSGSVDGMPQSPGLPQTAGDSLPSRLIAPSSLAGEEKENPLTRVANNVSISGDTLKGFNQYIGELDEAVVNLADPAAFEASCALIRTINEMTSLVIPPDTHHEIQKTIQVLEATSRIQISSEDLKSCGEILDRTRDDSWKTAATTQEGPKPVTVDHAGSSLNGGCDSGPAVGYTPRLLPPRRTPDLRLSRERVNLVNTLARELATLKPEFDRFCTADGLKAKYAQFVLWDHLMDSELKDLIAGDSFTPKAYAESLTLRKFGITSRQTLKKDRRKLRNAEKTGMA